MATIAEIVFIRCWSGIGVFVMLLLSGKMCCFLHFMQWCFGLDFFGIMWRNVIGALRGLGFGGFFRFSCLILVLVFLYCLWLF